MWCCSLIKEALGARWKISWICKSTVSPSLCRRGSLACRFEFVNILYRCCLMLKSYIIQLIMLHKVLKESTIIWFFNLCLISVYSRMQCLFPSVCHVNMCILLSLPNKIIQRSTVSNKTIYGSVLEHNTKKLHVQML